jgi:F-type H+-transporting ATPase subunit a
MGLSVTIFIGVTFLGLMIKKFSFFGSFVPEGTPLALVPTLTIIEFVSYSARAFSLGIRLFANIKSENRFLTLV